MQCKKFKKYAVFCISIFKDMAYIQSVRGKQPCFGVNCWLAPNATIVGDVEMGNDCSVWFRAVVRGDVNPIRIGNCCNIQDGAVLHCTFKRSSVWMGNYVSIGHNAIVHGCRIEDGVLVGMGAIVMDEAVVEEGAIIAAGAVVLERSRIEAGHLYAGIPAKKIKKVDATLRDLAARTSKNYVKYASWFKEKPTQAPPLDSL